MQFKLTEIKYVIMPAEGLCPDSEKVRATNDMIILVCAQDLSRFLGMANYLSRYVPNYTSVTELLFKDVDWTWSTPYNVAYHRIKDLIASAPVLRFIDPAVSALSKST